MYDILDIKNVFLRSNSVQKIDKKMAYVLYEVQSKDKEDWL